MQPDRLPAGSTVEISDAQLFSRCEGGIRWVETNVFGLNKIATVEGRSVTVGLDADGNATVALVAGPHCAVGDTVISGHTEGPEFESFSASFATLAPKQTPEGVTALPAKQVEDAGSSSAATIIEGEFPGASETMMRLAAPELFSRCEVGGPKLTWLRMNKELVYHAKELVGGNKLEPEADEAVRLDNDGNGFAIAIAHKSCRPGKSVIEADLEAGPFTTAETAFTILPPQETEF